ncbi:hypothetical protein CIX30_13540 [Salmonella enterica]|nr:hypothetical protein [Salmonella enterica]ECE6540367.1 hypothetical protein [Salmonella enterica subsp. enterica]ECS7525580.1 hypothetical protein [Salmonella enterica]ECU7993388.1 hypothetical protein [Salmonella enterica subsp. enterica serovar Toucra]EJX9799412.1 hypothetical protein [Salmonella enterica]
MNTEITIRNVQILRSGLSQRGFVSPHTLLSIADNLASKNAIVRYLGARIGRISKLYHSDLCDNRLDLRCNITFPRSLIVLADMVKDKALYPACVISTHENEAWLSEIFFVKEEFREFNEQEPINLSQMLDLVNNIAKSDAPANPQGDTPYIYAPGMDNDDIANWLNHIVSNLNTVDARKGRIKSLEEDCKGLKCELGEIETFLSKTIRA